MRKFNVFNQTAYYRLAYSNRTAFVMAELSRIVYLDENDIKDQISTLGFSLVDKLISCDETDTQCIVVTNGVYDVVVFRGTKGIEDILTDLNISKFKFANVVVHKGFSKAFLTVRDNLEFILKESDRPIFLAGHSLGGALANMACYFLSSDIKERFASCYTFGAPGVGDRAFCLELMDLPIYRIVLEQDVVARIPLLMRPVGSLFFIDGQDLFRGTFAAKKLFKNTMLNFIQLVNLFLAEKPILKNLTSVEELLNDHGIDCYRDKLLEIIVRKNQSLTLKYNKQKIDDLEL